MQKRFSQSRASLRQEMLRELAEDELIHVTNGTGHSRAVEAVEALRKIEKGTYGVCAECEKRIPPARLQAKPEATRCVSCQNHYEERTPMWQGGTDYVVKRSA